MCRFEKAEYAACITGKDGTIKAETRQGYTFTVKVAPRDVHEFATHRDDAGRWELTDTLTGMLAGMRDFDTRKAVAEYAETDAFKAKFAEVAGTWGYTAQVEAFARVCDGEAFTLKEYRKAVRDRKRELEAQDLEGKARAQGLDVEATVTEHADVTAVEFAPRKAEEPETIEPEEVKAQEAVTIETVTERFRGKTNIMVMQKNARACIWVEGDTKPIKEDLKAMGFKWAPKRKGWYLRTA